MTAGPIEPLGSRLTHDLVAGLVGRRAERDLLERWLATGELPAVVFVHGPGGIGKTALVRAVVASSDRRCLVLDGQDLEPTPDGLLTGIGRALGLDGPSDPTILANDLHRAGVAALIIDGFERLGAFDRWLRQELLPTLPGDVTTVLVGRRGPGAAWLASPGWRRLIADLELGPLTDPEVARIATGRGLSDDLTAKVVRFARGHPLAAELTSGALLRHPSLTLSEGPPADVVEDLYDLLLDDLPATHRRLVESVSVLRRTTRPLLAAVLDPDDQAVDDAWRILRGLSMVAATPAGLELSTIAADVVAGGFEARDPERVRELRRRAATAIVRQTGERLTWASTADLIHLVQNPIIRSAFLPCGGLQHPVERAHPDDLPIIRGITARFDGPAAAGLIDLWWQHHPASFLVSRQTDGEPRAYGFVIELDDLDAGLVAGDPVLTDIAADARRRPAGGRILINRRSLGSRLGEQNSPDLASVVVDLRRYVEQRPDLARIYGVIGNWAGSAGLVRLMGYARFGEPVDVGGRHFQPIALDLGPDGIDGWIARHVLPDMPQPVTEPVGQRVDGPGATAPASATSPSADALPPIATLSAREREVLAALSEGLTNQQLADRLFISERTANRHLSNIFTKLGVRNRTAAARLAIEAGLTS